MFAAFEQWGGPAERAVIAAPALSAPSTTSIEGFAGGHPHPTTASVAAAHAALRLAEGATESDRLVLLLSGGASALMAAPAPPLSLDDKVAVTQWALTRGLAIDGLNAVRKHLSLIKGGQLAAATRAGVWTFALSDVSQPVDDDPSTIGSGPTVTDPSTYEQAWSILTGLDPGWVRAHPVVASRLEAGLRGELAETPKVGDVRLSRAAFFLIGNRVSAMDGARAEAESSGWSVRVRQGAILGEARDAAARFVSEAVAVTADMPRPCCYVASGETTVTVNGRGRGGRNQEFVLASAQALAGSGLSATVASIGTDGIDGPTDAAGAIADETTCTRATALQLNPRRALDDNDAYPFFAALGDLVVSGPSGTNVGDLVLFVRG